MSKHHDTLQIKVGASKEEIKKAFRRLAMIHHPDKGGDTKVFVAIKDAYDFLMKQPEATYVHFDMGSGSGSYTAYAYRDRNGFWQTANEAMRQQQAAYQQQQQAQQQRMREEMINQLKKDIADTQAEIDRLRRELFKAMGL